LVPTTLTLLTMNLPNYQYVEGDFVRIKGDERGEYKNCLAVQLAPGAKPPERAHQTDAGADLFAYFGENLPQAYLTLEPGEQRLVDTGVAVKIPNGYAGFLMPRSSMRAKGITSWGDGLIDSAYRGTLKVVISNQGKEPYTIKAGDKIAQLVIQKIEIVGFVDIWNDTDRGVGGFGSTGK
jgi:dUTP pyrophosphatase